MIRELSKSASNLSNYVLEFDDFIPQIAEELGKIGVKLRSLERKLSGNHKASVRRVRRLVDQCEVLAHNKERVRQANLEIIKVIEELEEHQKDLHWEK